MDDDFIAMLESILPEGWELEDPSMGSSCMFVCPCGDTVEQDGECPEGHESPMISAGLI